MIAALLLAFLSFQLPGPGAFSVVTTSDGAVWTLSESTGGVFNHGLVRLSPEGVLTEVVPPMPRFNGPLAADDEAIWIGSSGGVDRYDRATGELRYFPLGYVRDIATAFDGTLWAAGEKNLFRIARDGAILDVIALPVHVGDLHSAADGGVWIAPQPRRYPFLKAVFRISRSGALVQIDLPFEPLRVLAGDDAFWVTTEDGRVARVAFDGSVLAMHDVSWNVVHAAVADGDFWFATHSGGLTRISRDGLVRSYPMPRLPETSCSSASWTLPIHVHPSGIVAVLSQYEGDNGIGITPCVVERPHDFLVRTQVDDLVPLRRRAVRK